MDLRAPLVRWLSLVYLASLLWTGLAWADEGATAPGDAEDPVQIVPGSLKWMKGGPKAEQGPAWIADGMPGLVGLDSPEQGLGMGAYWFTFRVRNTDSGPQRRILSLVRSHHWQHAEIFQVSGSGVTRQWDLDTRGPPSARPFGHGNLAFPVPFPGNEAFTFVLRFEPVGAQPIQLQPVVASEQAYVRDLRSKTAFTWLFNGLMAVMAIYHALVFFSLRDTAYLYFVGVITAALGMNLAAANELQTILQFDQALLVLDYFPRFGIGLCAMWCFFSAQALVLPDGMSWMTQTLRGLGVLELLILAPLALLPLQYTMLCFFGTSSLSMLACIAAGVVSWRSGYAPARLYMATWSAYFALVALQGLSANINFGIYREFLGATGTAFQIVMFGLVLARRYALINEDLGKAQAGEIAAQAQALRTKEEAAATLQQKVNDRTAELAAEKHAAEEAHEVAETARSETEEAVAMLQEALSDAHLARLDAEQEREASDAAHRKIADLDRQKTHFFQNISHELRTPLTLVLNPLEDAVLDHHQDERLQMAERNARRLLRLVNQLLDFQKLAAGKRSVQLQHVDLQRFACACADQIRSTCAGRDITLRVMLDGQEVSRNRPDQTPLFILGEIDALEKIVFNYLSNALKFTPSGGEIRIELSAVHGQLRLAVCDTGPGIAEDDQAKLFQLFSQVDGSATREAEGTGLGLALVKELTEQLQGCVGVQSNQGHGARFWCAFPAVDAPEQDSDIASLEDFQARPWLLADQAAQNDSGPPPEEEASGDGQHILIVDEMADMRKLIADTLRRNGYCVRTAKDAFDALDQSHAQPPELIVTDWMMPRKSGLDLITDLRADPCLGHLPVILLTARSDEEGKLLGTEVGADAFLGKPFNEQELCATVRNLLALKEHERELEAAHRQLQEGVLKRYLPPDLVDAIVNGTQDLSVEPDHRTITVLFADLKGFTQATEKLRATRMAALLNEHLAAMTEVIFEHGGTIDKFVGDAVMVVFGAPSKMEGRDQARRAVACGLAMQRTMAVLSETWKQRGIPDISMRVGIHHGPAVVGNFGSEQRLDYTAIGHTVNLASRVEGACEPGSVFVTPEVVDFLPEDCVTEAGSHELKGIEGNTRLFRILPESADILKKVAA